MKPKAAAGPFRSPSLILMPPDMESASVRYAEGVTHPDPLVVTLTGTDGSRDDLSGVRVDIMAPWTANATGSAVDGNWTSSAAGGDPFRTLPEMVIIGLILGLVILLTVGGNLLVCVTIATYKRLQTCTNYFVLSLAVTDLLLGCLVLPFSALVTLDFHWPLGAAFCNIYTACDVMLCTVSILTLFAISLDRYFAVTSGMRYQQTMNGRIVWKIVTGIWIFSFLMAFVPIHLGWNTATGAVMNWAAPDQCVFELNKAYVLLVSLGTYFAPLLIMCAVYLKVLQITRTQVKEINKLTKAGSGLAAAMLEPPPPPPPTPAPSVGGGGSEAGDGGRAAGRNGSRGQNGHQMAPPGAVDNGVAAGGMRRSPSAAAGKGADTQWDSPPDASGAKHKQYKMLSDTKATVTLASVILAFAICWVPYFVLFTAKPFLSGDVNAHVDLLALWLGYVNSSINPFLYAFYNSSFREGFRKVLCRHQCTGTRAKRKPRFDMQYLAPQIPAVRGRRQGSSSETSEFSALRQSL